MHRSECAVVSSPVIVPVRLRCGRLMKSSAVHGGRRGRGDRATGWDNARDRRAPPRSLHFRLSSAGSLGLHTGWGLLSLEVGIH
eukprot:4998673-Prymnesium_polylepis.1